eukprot:jgi/Botrbrau1/11691/Bobra.0195s0022.1
MSLGTGGARSTGAVALGSEVPRSESCVSTRRKIVGGIGGDPSKVRWSPVDGLNDWATGDDTEADGFAMVPSPFTYARSDTIDATSRNSSLAKDEHDSIVYLIGEFPNLSPGQQEGPGSDSATAVPSLRRTPLGRGGPWQHQLSDVSFQKLRRALHNNLRESAQRNG